VLRHPPTRSGPPRVAVTLSYKRKGIRGATLASECPYRILLRRLTAPQKDSRQSFKRRSSTNQGQFMGRGILLWMLGVPIPVILLLAMCSHH